jgi:hypothetical protein
VLQVPDPGAGEGVPHEPLPHQAQAHRDGTPALPHRATDQNLVPEQVGTISRYYSLTIQNRWAPFPDTSYSKQSRTGTISRNQLNNPEQVGTNSRNQLNNPEQMGTNSRNQLNNPEQVGICRYSFQNLALGR